MMTRLPPRSTSRTSMSGWSLMGLTSRSPLQSCMCWMSRYICNMHVVALAGAGIVGCAIQRLDPLWDDELLRLMHATRKYAQVAGLVGIQQSIDWHFRRKLRDRGAERGVHAKRAADQHHLARCPYQIHRRRKHRIASDRRKEHLKDHGAFLAPPTAVHDISGGSDAITCHNRSLFRCSLPIRLRHGLPPASITRGVSRQGRYQL